MSEYLQIFETNQDMTGTMMFIVLLNFGLILIALIVGILNYIRTSHMMNRDIILENEIQGTPVTLEDLIQRDLMEQTAQVELTSKGLEGVTPMTDEELLEIMEETTGEKMT